MPMPPPKPSTEGPRDRQVFARDGPARPGPADRGPASPEALAAHWSARATGSPAASSGRWPSRSPTATWSGPPTAGSPPPRRSRRRRSVGSPAPAGPRHRLELGDIDLLARGVREPDVAGPVVERRDAADAGVQPQVAAVRRRARTSGAAPAVHGRAAPATSPTSGCAGVSRPLANWPPGQVTVGRVVAQPRVGRAAASATPPRARAARRPGPRRAARRAGPPRRAGRARCWPSRRRVTRADRHRVRQLGARRTADRATRLRSRLQLGERGVQRQERLDRADTLEPGAAVRRAAGHFDPERQRAGVGGDDQRRSWAR